MSRRLLALILLPLALLAALVGCGAGPAVSPTSVPAPPPPSVVPPAAALLPTVSASTAVPPTATPVPPTVTSAPPTATPAPSTNTPVPPTVTSAPPTDTPAPPTATAAPPTAAPAAARSLVQAAGSPVRLVVPAINLDRTLVSVGLDRNRIPVVPNHDVGWYNLSAAPGQGENIVLWGHVLRFHATPKIPAPFERLKELPVGARLTLYDAGGTAHPYVVIEKVWATPQEVTYILPRGRELLTLVSCIGDKVVVDGSTEMTHRLITIAAPAE